MNHKERKRQMEYMRFIELKTLKQIGRVFGLSKERVRQIIGNTGKGFVPTRNMLAVTGKEHLTHTEVARQAGLSPKSVSKYRRGENFKIDADPDEPISVGAEFQDLCAMKLEEMGIEIDYRTGRNNPVGYHIRLANGLKIAVRGASKQVRAPSVKDLLRSPAWNFGIHRENLDCDFFILITAMDDYFVVPAEEMEDRVYVRFCWPTLRPTMSKFGKYHNAFHLLR